MDEFEQECNGFKPIDKAKKKRKRKRNKAPKCSAEHGEEEGGENDEIKESAHQAEAEAEAEEERKLNTNKNDGDGCGIMSNVTFHSLGLSQPTFKAINDMGFQNTTHVPLFYFILFFTYIILPRFRLLLDIRSLSLI